MTSTPTSTPTGTPISTPAGAPTSTGPTGPVVPTPGARYLTPDRLTRRLVNPAMSMLVRLGIGLRGGRILHVRGRRSGEWRNTPVNPLTIDGATYLVAPRGHTEWVRNLRVAGTGRLQRGRRFTEFAAVELPDVDKAPIIREYLRRWAFEVGAFFDDLDQHSSDAEIAAVAAGFPVFRIST